MSLYVVLIAYALDNIVFISNTQFGVYFWYRRKKMKRSLTAKLNQFRIDVNTNLLWRGNDL